MPVFHRDERAGQPRRDLAAEWLITPEHVAHHAAPAGEVDHVGLQADQATRRDGAFETDAVWVMLHVRDLRFAARKILHDVAEAFAGISAQSVSNGSRVRPANPS